MEIKVHPSFIKSCKYILLPGKCPADFNHKELYNKAYMYWRDFWNLFFEKNNLLGSLHPDDFLRQDFIPIFLHEEEIVGMHLYTQFDMELAITPELSYFRRSFNDEYMRELAKRNVKTSMSLEFLTVSPEWRKSRTGISFGQLLIGIGARIQKYLGIDASIAISRSDVKVTQTAAEFGWDVIMPNVMLHTKPCDLIALFKNKIKNHPDPTVNEYVDFFWNNRIDLTGRLTNQKTKKKVA